MQDKKPYYNKDFFYSAQSYRNMINLNPALLFLM